MEPRQVEAGRGWYWVTEGFELFRKAPGVWIVVFVLYAGLVFLCSMVPLVGAIASGLLSVLLSGGLMRGCRDLDAGEGLRVDHLFLGFSYCTNQLVMIGLVTVGVSAVAGAVLVFGLGGSALSLGSGGSGLDLPQLPISSLLSVTVASLIVMLLIVPLAMATWFAPALVMLEGLEGSRAMWLSLRGCARNVLPFLVYGLVMLVLLFVAGIPAGLGMLVAGPILIASVYVGYRDIFGRPSNMLKPY